MSDIDKLKFDYGQAKVAREKFEDFYEAAYRITYPERGTQFGLTIEDGAYIFDLTVKEAARLLASAIVTGIIPTGLSWLEAVPNKGRDVSNETIQWLQDFSDIAMQYVDDSNLAALKLEFALDLTVAGVAGLYCDFDVDEDHLIFEEWRIEQMYIARQKGFVIDTVYRDTPLTIDQVVARGYAPTPIMREELRDETRDRNKDFNLVHGILPRDGGKSGGFSEELPVRSVYFSPDEEFILQDLGFEEFPGAITRWKLLPSSEYAVGPVHEIIPTFSAANETQDLMVQNLDVQVNPAIVVADDGVVQTRTLSIDARKVIIARETNSIKRIGTETNLPYAISLKQDLREQIRSLMMTDQLLPLDRPNATATEIRTRTLLIRRILGPSFTRPENELLPGLSNRIFGLLLRNGKAPVMSDTVRQELLDEKGGISFTTNFINDNTRSQNSEELANINDFEAGLGVVAQVSPTTLDVYDFDKAAALKSRLLSLPVELMRNETEIQDLRDDRQERIDKQRQEELEAQQKPPTQGA